MQNIFSLSQKDDKSLHIYFTNELKKEMGELTTEQFEQFEERAAIMEYEGGLSKEEAEWRSLQIILLDKLKMAV
ncbi:MAG: hypothetical protein H6627_04020 [Calditrichae bacterium]|nr:hypothetical protein [Calditrichota bacterium]MCB9057708.1 hypothetical protein [Calditrichia bacterium]